MAATSDWLIDATVYLGAAVIAAPLAKRLGLGSVLGFLAAGVAVGPYALGLVGEEAEDLMHVAEFGVVIMLFLIGLELRLTRLWRLRKPILGLGGLQVTLTTAALAATAILAGWDWRAALAIGLIFSLSSTAIVMQTLAERGLDKSAVGQSAFSVLLFQDIAVIPILAILPLLAVDRSGMASPMSAEILAASAGGTDIASGWAGLEQVAIVGGALAALILFSRTLARPMFRYVARAKMEEVFVAAALFLIVGAAVLMQSVGLSPALGAFVAGVVLADNEYRHEIEADIAPFKGLFLGLFFITVGASIDFSKILENPSVIALGVVALIAIKGFILYVLGRMFGMGFGAASLFAASLAQGSEFAFVLVSFAMAVAVINAELGGVIIAVVALSMLLAPFLTIAQDHAARVLGGPAQPIPSNEPGDEAPDPEDAEPEALIAGYGRFGMVVTRFLRANGVATTVLDHDEAQVALVRRFGAVAFFGDATRVDLLAAAGAGKAKLIVIALDDREAVLRLVDLARKHFPDAALVARAYDRRHAYELLERGVEHIVRETFAAALEAGEIALTLTGARAHRARRSAHLFRRHDEISLRELSQFWGDDTAYILHQNKRYEEIEAISKADRRALTQPDRAWDKGGAASRDDRAPT